MSGSVASGTLRSSTSLARGVPAEAWGDPTLFYVAWFWVGGAGLLAGAAILESANVVGVLAAAVTSAALAWAATTVWAPWH